MAGAPAARLAVSGPAPSLAATAAQPTAARQRPPAPVPSALRAPVPVPACPPAPAAAGSGRPARSAGRRASSRRALDPDRTTDRGPDSVARCPSPVRLASEHVNPQTGEIVGQGEAVTIDCDRWTCAHCGPAKRRRLVAHYTETLGAADALHLVTLTLDPSTGIQPDESRRYAVHLWSLVRKRLHRMARRAGHVEGVRYVAAVEWQKRTGLAHLHVVASLPGIEPDQAAAAWAAVGGGVVADVQPISRARFTGEDRDGPRGSAARAVGYVLKYALKEATESPVPGRRYLLASQGAGYYSAPARARRRAYVEEQRGAALPPPGEPRPVPGTDLVEILVPTVTRPPGLCPDTITAADRLRFAELRAAARRTSYRYLDKRSGQWWRIEQQGERRTRHRIAPPARWQPRAKSQPPPAPPATP